jgi:hypothetical protein
MLTGVEWPPSAFPFPEEEPPPHDDAEFRADVEALRAQPASRPG